MVFASYGEWRTTVEAQSTLNGHTVRVDGSGRIEPWYTPQGDAYDRVMSLAWNFLLNDVPTASNGYKYYYLYSRIDPNTLAPANWPNNPGSVFPGFTESAIAYYAYSGNPAVMTLVRDVLTHHLNQGMTPTTWHWSGVPFASGNAGEPTYRGDGSIDTVNHIQPDKVGDMGTAFFRYYLFSGDVRFRDAAIRCADALASHVRNGDTTRSPWPFRVNAQTNVVREEYTAHVIAPIQLFDLLIAKNVGNVATYSAARQTAWNWLMQYPMQNDNWSNYFEDIPPQPNVSNYNQLVALETARYLLRFPEIDPAWETHVREIIGWVERTFAEPQFGANAINEQMYFYEIMGSHTARYASINAMLYEKTGDAAAREKAYRAFNWASYMCRTNGRVVVGPSVNEMWFTDGYGDYIRHFMWGLGAVPEWAPTTQNHLLRSTSVIRSITYGAGDITYTSVDSRATDVFRLTFTPQSVTVDGQPLAQRADLSQPGWTFNASTGTLRIRHDTGTLIRLTQSGTQTPVPPTVVGVTPTSGSSVAVDTIVTARFSEPMDPASITTSTFLLRTGSTTVSGTVTYSSGTSTATLTPASQLQAGTTYTATVKGGAADPRVKDSGGTAMSADYSWTFTTAAAPPAPPPGNGLVGAWAFNEGSGSTASDRSGSGLTATISGATWTSAGRFGAALQFDGTNDLLTVPDAAALDLTAGMTLEAWVYPTASGGWRSVLMKESTNGLAWALYAQNNTPPPAVTVNTGTSDLATPGTQALPLNTWTFLAATYDGATVRFFVNGAEVGSRSAGGSLIATAGALRFGGNSVWGEYFSGRLDEIRVYNRRLTVSEIQADMNNPVSSSPPPVAPTNLRIIR